MTAEQPHDRQVPARSRRDDTIQALSTAFAQDELSMEEFERRLDIAHRTTVPAELDALLSDLRTSASPVPSSRTTESVVPRAPAPAPSEIRSHQTLVAIMGGVERKGPWTPARH